MTSTAVPSALKINNKSISFPYINKKINVDPVNRLVCNIMEFEDDKPSNFFTASLKFVFCEYYPQYSQYLKKHPHPILQEIDSYYNTLILKVIEYKYKVGQFGYISGNSGDSLEQSFVIITQKLQSETEIFFLHAQLKKYKFHRYDITSPTPKILTDAELGNQCASGWTIETLFSPIDGTIEPTNDATNDLIELLNWKICREDYLLKKMNRMKLGLSENTINNIDNGTIFLVGPNKTNKKPVVVLNSSTNDDTMTDDDQTSYLPDSEEKSSSYYTTDSNISSNDTTDCKNVSSLSGTSAMSTDDDEKLLLLADFGYYKEKHLCYTLKGELFVALNKNNKDNMDEEVAIKKTVSYTGPNGFRIVIDAHLVREALISRQLKTENTLMKNSIVKYIDFFQSKTHYFSVMEMDFSINLKEFVIKSHEYIKNGKLALSEYHETIKYLLWRLSATIHWLHNDLLCCDLDVCPENIMLSRAEFIQNSDGSVAINLQIEMKMIDFGVRELLELCNYDKLKEFKCRYNKQYLELKNEQFVTPESQINNNGIQIQQYYDPRAADMWSFGMVIYFCFFGNYPYTETPHQETTHDNITSNEDTTGYWSVYNGKLNEFIQTKSGLKFIDPNVLSLINGLLSVDETKRLKSIQVLQHKWFNSFYKAYLSVRGEQDLNI